jgi:hypothetical protein
MLRICVCVCVCVRVSMRVRVALFIHHATRMRHIVTSFVAPLSPPYSSTLSHKRHDFSKKKVTEHKTFLILKRIWRDIVINVKSLYVKYSLFLSNFNET